MDDARAADLLAEGCATYSVPGAQLGLLERVGGNTFVVQGDPPGAMAIAIDGDLLYMGPFVLPRIG